MARKTAPYELRWAYRLPRKRETPVMLYAKSSSWCSWKAAHCCGVTAACASEAVSEEFSLP
jgi:hypothetical protein